MTINQAALDLIKVSEGFENHWYPDPGTGAEPMTAAFGHTSAAGPPHYWDDPHRIFTEAEGEAILRQDLANTEGTVNRLVKVPLTENQYGALVSFVFNIGGEAFAASTCLRVLNAGDYVQAASEILRLDHGGGRVLPGLTIRRTAEHNLFMGPPADKPPVTPYPTKVVPPYVPPAKTPPATHPAVPTTIGGAILAGAGAIAYGVPWPWIVAAVIVLGIGGYVAFNIIRNRK